MDNRREHGMSYTRRLDITVIKEGFRVETSYLRGNNDLRSTRVGTWGVLSTTITKYFPHIILERVAGRNDYKVFIHS